MTLEEYYNILKKGYDGWDNQYKFAIDNLTNNISFGFSRFNDGEMMAINKIGSIVSRGDQLVNESLHKALIEAISHKQENYYIGIPCELCYPIYNKLANDIIGNYEYKISAISLINRNWAKFVSELSDSVSDNKVRYVSGEDQDITFLKEIINLNIVNHTKIPSKNAWEHIDKLDNYINEVEDGDVVLISLGPTARVLVRRWFELKPKATFIDFGSLLDPFTRGVWHNYHKGWDKSFNMTSKCNNCN
tara:strand:- start:1018 stop:1758 length:741 start_codon:yes stop_codon:yes gene_type:complete